MGKGGQALGRPACARRQVCRLRAGLAARSADRLSGLLEKSDRQRVGLAPVASPDDAGVVLILSQDSNNSGASIPFRMLPLRNALAMRKKPYAQLIEPDLLALGNHSGPGLTPSPRAVPSRSFFASSCACNRGGCWIIMSFALDLGGSVTELSVTGSYLNRAVMRSACNFCDLNAVRDRSPFEI